MFGMTSDASASEPNDMTIDEVARFADVPSSTVRMYQNKGLLPAPVKRGRVGYYTKQHRDRLRLIAHLQSRGFSLAAIKELLDSWNAGQTLGRAMGVTEVAPSMDREPSRLTMAELRERFDGVPITQAELQRAQALGLIHLEGAELVVSNNAFGEIGPSVARLGLPLSEILDEYEALAEAVDGIAERFRSVFERHIWSPFVQADMRSEAADKLLDEVGELTHLATSVVTVALHERFNEFATDYLAKAQAALADE